jgi:hypothetical protein
VSVDTLSPQVVQESVEAWLTDATLEEALDLWSGHRELTLADGTRVREHREYHGVRFLNDVPYYSAAWL